MSEFKNKFILGDCMDAETGLPSYPDKYFDLAVVDPPYGIGAASSNFTRYGKQTGKSLTVSGINYKPKEWDKIKPDCNYFKELFRVCKNSIIWGGNYYELPASSCWVVWDKETGDNLYADCELAWTSFNTAVRKAKFMWKGMFQGDMSNKETRIHPTQKPVALYKWLLQNYAQPGDLILDTHVGSASSLIACESMDFNYHAWEIDPDYYAAAKNRMSKGIQKVLL